MVNDGSIAVELATNDAPRYRDNGEIYWPAGAVAKVGAAEANRWNEDNISVPLIEVNMILCICKDCVTSYSVV